MPTRSPVEATFRCRRIELRVHSALEAVGLTAAVSGALADAGLTANVVAGAHHDHLLVAADTRRGRPRGGGRAVRPTVEA